MDTFKLTPGVGREIPITEDNYFRATQRHELYCSTAQSGNALYLAVCPECDNPIEIRNLGAVHDVNRDDPKKPFGKHYVFTVPGLAVANRTAYENCSKRGHVTLGTSEHRSNDRYNKELLRTLVDHAAVIRELLADALGVTVGQRLFERLVDQFVRRSAYKCKGVQVSNLPYAIAYWAENQSIWKQVVRDPALRAAIKDSGLGYFYVNENNQIDTVDKVKARRSGSTSPLHGRVMKKTASLIQ